MTATLPPRTTSASARAGSTTTSGSPTTAGSSTTSGSPTTAELKARFAPVFARIAEDEARRRDTAEAPHEAVRLLADSGFTALQVPRDHGGVGATLGQLVELLIDLAAADPNLPQALHGHFMFTEQVLRDVHPGLTDWWLAEVAAGRVFANALVDPPQSTGLPGVTAQADALDPDVFVLEGVKQYSTGTLLADWTLVTASGPAGTLQPLVVDVHAEGVEVHDDWDGIGQRATASGTTVYRGVRVPRWRRVGLDRPASGPGYALLWVILSATQAGIAQSALSEFTELLQRRSRTYEHAAADTPAQDPVLQHQLGAAAAQVRALRSVVLGAVPALEAAYAAVPLAAPPLRAAAAKPDDGPATEPDSAADPAAFEAAHTEAWVAAASAASVAAELALRVSTDLFETAGASATLASKHLDRHWRNVRVLASHTPLPHRRRVIGDVLLNGTTAPLTADAAEKRTVAAGTGTGAGRPAEPGHALGTAPAATPATTPAVTPGEDI